MLPFLCLQPLVENAVRHGLSGKPGGGTVSIVARDAGAECAITVEDDGVGHGPRSLRSGPADAVRLRRQVDAGRTSAWPMWTNGCGRRSATTSGWWWRPAPGAGTKVSMRVPKFRPESGP